MKKLIATFLAAIMLVPVAMAATLGEFPGFLATKTDTTSRANAYVIVGRSAAASDVLGGIDLAVRIAEMNYDVKQVPGGVTVSCEYGTCKGDEITFNTNIQTELGTELKTAIGLGTKTITYNRVQYTIKEKVLVPDVKVLPGGMSLNGTIGASLEGISQQLAYVIEFDEDLNASKFSDVSPLTVNILGKEFSITGVGDGEITVLTGTVGISDSVTGTGVTYGDYTVYVVDGSAEAPAWVEVVVKDAQGNEVGHDYIEKGAVYTFVIGDYQLQVKVLEVRTSTITGKVSARMVVGPEVDKTYKEGDTFPGSDLWVFKEIKTDITDLSNKKLQKIKVEYNIEGEEVPKALPLGEKIVAPNNMFEFGISHLTVKSFVTLTFSPTKIDLYANEDATTAFLKGKPAIKIEATGDVLTFGADEVSEAYVVCDGCPTSPTYYVAYPILVGTTKKIVNITEGTNDITTFDNIQGKFEDHSFNITLLNKSDDETVFTGLKLKDGGNNYITMSYNFTSAGVILGLSSSAEGSDVKDWNGEDAGTYEVSDLVSLYGSVLKANIKANAENQKVVVELPAEQQKAFVYIGKIGEVVTTGGTYKEMVPIKTPVTRFADEITASDKTSTKAFVLVGGPCVNELVAELAADGKLKDSTGYTITSCEAWPGRDFALIQLIEDAYGTTGKVVLVVAGTRAQDTLLAAQYLQAGKLEGSTAKAVEVTGTTVATATATPIA
ncbi:MAG: S-layer protein [Candidatus Aenigmatarchaeota archaeon]